MIKVKQLFVLWESDFGDKKLIPKDEFSFFQNELKSLEKELLKHRSHGSDMSIEKAEGVEFEIYDLIDQYNTLEGEEVYVVLPKDIIKGETN